MGEMLKQTLQMAKHTQVPIKDICDGAKVKRWWYRRLIAGEFEDPGVNKVERLHKFLKKSRQRKPS